MRQLAVLIALSAAAGGCSRQAGRGGADEIRGVPVETAGSRPEGLPAAAPPANYQLTQMPGGEGRILRASFSGNARSAQTALQGFLTDLGSSYFSGKPRVQAALASADDQRAQALFAASLGGAAAAGLMMVELQDGAGRVTVLVDAAERFRASLPAMARQVGGGSETAPAQPKRQIQWVQHQFPDGSGSIQLPSDWRMVSAAKGAVDALGPNGEVVGLGGPYMVNTNSWYAQSGYLVGPYMRPLQALQYLYPQMARQAAQAGYQKQLVRILETQETTEQGVPMAYTLYDGTVNGRAYRWYELDITRMIDQSMWTFYLSQVGAPEEIFAREFGTMIAIWQSWQISGRLIASRLASAVESMRQAGEIYRSANQSAGATYDRTNRAWSLYMRGNELVEHLPSGGRGEVDQNYAQRMVERLNEAEGGQTWRVVPMRDY